VVNVINFKVVKKVKKVKKEEKRVEKDEVNSSLIAKKLYIKKWKDQS